MCAHGLFIALYSLSLFHMGTGRLYHVLLDFNLLSHNNTVITHGLFIELYIYYPSVYY